MRYYWVQQHLAANVKRDTLALWSLYAVLILVAAGCTPGKVDSSGPHQTPDTTLTEDATDTTPEVRSDAAHDSGRDIADSSATDAAHDAGLQQDAPSIDVATPIDANERDDTEDIVDTSAPPPAQIQAYFNIPGADGTPDTALEDVILDLLQQAAPGSQVRLALFTINRNNMANALADAYDRGVDVEIVLGNTNAHVEGCVPYVAVKTFKRRMNDALTICRECEDGGGCIGTFINHTKFLTFSELTDGTQNVVVQSSANFTAGQLGVFNNLVVVRDDPALYQGYLDYWNDMKAQQQDDDYYTKVYGDTPTKAYFFPRKDGDTIVEALNNLDCSDDAHVRLAMSGFTKNRLAVAQKMVSMKSAGCAVEVLVSADAEPEPIQTLRDGGVSTKVYTRINGVSIHSKYLLLDGRYYDGTRRKLVFTGSHNYTYTSLHMNDETMLKVDDRPTYNAYLENWELIRDRIDAL